MTLLIIGASGGSHVGEAFLRASLQLEGDSSFIDIRDAHQPNLWIRRVYWHLGGKRPSKLDVFSQQLVQQCQTLRPKWLLTTGLAPINQAALSQIGAQGVYRINFLTDDPWNRAHYAPWFLKALPHYDSVFSPRRANLEDLRQAGCKRVEYLPFGYDPDLFFPETPSPAERQPYEADVVFAGGADRDRVPYIHTLIQAGLTVNLYGGYWERYPETLPYTRGQADIQTLRVAISTAKVALCLVRRANRDGNCMRTFEVPAIGACMLTEDTPEHREIFGAEGEAVVYFKTPTEMLEKTQWLLNHDAERQRLAASAHQLITQGAHTYSDRLKTMLSL
jgi:spore maturation protein CgeB